MLCEIMTGTDSVNYPPPNSTQPLGGIMELSQDYLKSILNYNPETGVFTWARFRGGMLAGAAAGTKHSAGYVSIRIHNAPYFAHRLAFLYMDGSFPPSQVDHIDGNGRNNRWANLRLVTNLENSRNQARHARNTSGVLGVCWRERRRKWLAQIKVRGKIHYLGYFKEFDAAVSARKMAEQQHGFHENHGRNGVAYE